MLDIIRDATLGQFLNKISGGKILPYADQRPGYQVDTKYLPSTSTIASSNATLCGDNVKTPAEPATSSDAVTLVNAAGLSTKLDSAKLEVELEKGLAVPATVPGSPYLVDWDGPDDPDNPMNWSRSKRFFIMFLIVYLTYSIYAGSSIYTAGIPSLMEKFNTTQTIATSGLTLFVIGYGIGPMVLAPLQEMPSIGRNPVYIAGLFLFCLFQAPLLAPHTNMATILVFRLLMGIAGSPILATGGASVSDIFTQEWVPIAVGLWSIGACCGPILGPTLGAFASSAHGVDGYLWPTYVLLWLAASSLIIMTIALPETYGPTILLKRAQRLRRLTGNPLLRSQSEIDQAEGATMLGLAWENIHYAFKLSVTPAVLVPSIFIALEYSILYTFFEAFPLVFTDIYHMNLGESTLPFLGFAVAAVPTFIFYVYYYRVPLKRRLDIDPDLPPETRLELALIGSVFGPISLLMFGWGSRADVHWIVPVIGASLFFPSIYLAFQSILVYITLLHPKRAGSLLAGNDFFRSTIASVFPLFGKALFTKLGLGGGSTLLAALTALFIPILIIMIKIGPRLRARSI